MAKKRVGLPIDQKLLPHLKEAILFVKDTGEIIGGNDDAYTLLDIAKQSNTSSVYNFLDFDLLKITNDTHLLMEQLNKKDKVVEVKSIKMYSNIYCLILNKLSLHDKAEEIKKYITDHVFKSSEGIVMYGKSEIIDCDQTFANMFGYSINELRNMPIHALFCKKESVPLDNHNYPASPLTAVKKDGTKFYVELNEHPYNDQGNIFRFAIIKDVTERVENEKQIEFMAFYDKLTELPNRNYFAKVLDEAIYNAAGNNEMLAVYFIDLDYFKEINDTLGYSFGDKLLKACANRLKAVLGSNSFIARMGGDEFLILQWNINKRLTIELAETLIAEFEKPFKIDEYEIFTSISIGISIYPENGKTGNDLIKHADSAMYVIKEKHRNNYNLFNTSISEEFKKKVFMENELRKALREGQFELHYQPQKNLYTNKVVGLEALLRWNHPEKGSIPPGEFIPLAERTGLIIEIGDWVLREACSQNKVWQKMGYTPLKVSVNLSAKQFHQRSLVKKVKKTLSDTGLNPEYLELEITESMAMSNEEFILQTMHGLRMLGVNVSIDDFGTGYSSFKYLSMFPISKLKIDKIFMDGSQQQNQAIVKSIIHMSHSLNMKVIAEGVETPEQLHFLKNENCDEMQGFYFSKPLPPEQLTKFLSLA